MRLALAVLACLACAAPCGAAADEARPDTLDAPADTATVARDPQETVHPPIERVARLAGFENVTVERGSGLLRVAYENRRFRHSADALGWIERGGDSLIAFERRFGATAAAILPPAPRSEAPFRILYPSDAGFPRPPRGRVQDPTWRSVDVTVGPLVAYDLGRVTE